MMTVSPLSVLKMSPTATPHKLFQSVRVGEVHLQHRVVLAPLTRTRANTQHEPNDISITYYAQRASVPGTLLITEGTFIAAQAGGINNVPGIWSEKQITQWKRASTSPGLPRRVIHPLTCAYWLYIVDHRRRP